MEKDHWSVSRLEQIEYQLNYEIKRLEQNNPNSTSETVNTLLEIKREELTNIRINLAKAREKKDLNKHGI